MSTKAVRHVCPSSSLGQTLAGSASQRPKRRARRQRPGCVPTEPSPTSAGRTSVICPGVGRPRSDAPRQPPTKCHARRCIAQRSTLVLRCLLARLLQQQQQLLSLAATGSCWSSESPSKKQHTSCANIPPRRYRDKPDLPDATFHIFIATVFGPRIIGMAQRPTSQTPRPPYPFPDVELATASASRPSRKHLAALSASFPLPAKRKTRNQKKTYRAKAYPAAGAAPRRRRTAAAASFMVAGLLWYTEPNERFWSSAQPEPARATRKCVRGVFAGCLVKGYELKRSQRSQSLGRWDACLRYQINRMSHHSAPSFSHWIRLGGTAKSNRTIARTQGQGNGDEPCPPQRRPPRSPGAGLLFFFFVPLYLLVELLRWRHLE